MPLSRQTKKAHTFFFLYSDSNVFRMSKKETIGIALCLGIMVQAAITKFKGTVANKQ